MKKCPAVLVGCVKKFLIDILGKSFAIVFLEETDQGLVSAVLCFVPHNLGSEEFSLINAVRTN